MHIYKTLKAIFPNSWIIKGLIPRSDIGLHLLFTTLLCGSSGVRGAMGELGGAGPGPVYGGLTCHASLCWGYYLDFDVADRDR